MLRYLLVIVALCFATTGIARSESWMGIPSSSASIHIDKDSFGPVAGSLHAIGFWVHASYGMSIECSPPRGCYAASQRMYVSVLCPIGAVAVLRRISMDLNGSIVADASADVVRYSRSLHSSLERDLVQALCGRRWRHHDDD